MCVNVLVRVSNPYNTSRILCNMNILSRLNVV